MNPNLKSKHFLALVLFLTIILVLIVFSGRNYCLKNANSSEQESRPELIENLTFNFNESGFPFYVVPNIVHIILFDVKI